ncbi:energy transducer TonB [Roseococcus sp. YIM B11640]|uniref:energy transducer TonB n=1 Tax=Roseococcus sp. YIM B11640 TaxID=3133973 RepID=UPI003C7D5B8A
MGWALLASLLIHAGLFGAAALWARREPVAEPQQTGVEVVWDEQASEAVGEEAMPEAPGEPPGAEAPQSQAEAPPAPPAPPSPPPPPMAGPPPLPDAPPLEAPAPDLAVAPPVPAEERQALPLPPPPPPMPPDERPPEPEMAALPRPPPAPPPAPPQGRNARRGGETAPSASGQGRVTGAVAPPSPDTRYRNTAPAYPEPSRLANEQGSVAVDLTVNAEGRVTSAVVARSSGFPRLDAAALRAVEQWRFRPATADGMAVPGAIRTTVHFRLQ